MVLVVVGLLVSIVVPKFTAQLGHAKEATSRANLETLRSAVGIYAKDNGTNPTTLAMLVSAGIIREEPMDGWGSPFQYDDIDGEVCIDCDNTSPCDGTGTTPPTSEHPLESCDW